MALLMVWSLFHLRPHRPFLSTQKFMYVTEKDYIFRLRVVGNLRVILGVHWREARSGSRNPSAENLLGLESLLWLLLGLKDPPGQGDPDFIRGWRRENKQVLMGWWLRVACRRRGGSTWGGETVPQLGNLQDKKVIHCICQLPKPRDWRTIHADKWFWKWGRCTSEDRIGEFPEPGSWVFNAGNRARDKGTSRNWVDLS